MEKHSSLSLRGVPILPRDDAAIPANNGSYKSGDLKRRGRYRIGKKYAVIPGNDPESMVILVPLKRK